MATCRTCAYLRKCIEKATKGGYEHNENFDPKDGCTGIGYKSNTNADRIRAMSDEALADLLARTQISNVTEALKEVKVPYKQTEGLKDKFTKECLDWLKQPAEVE